ncbi:MAG: hypothetical protein IKH32_02015 [Prevotella sp.]|nr:hypothetical protein [Prevotella sp.]
MATGNSTHIQHIVAFLQQATRNRLVFCHDHIDDLLYVNIGRTLANLLSNENLRSPMIAYAAEDALAEILSLTQEDSHIGTYVAIENIGILFEPDLGINLKSTLDSASTNKTIIICSNGMVKDDKSNRNTIYPFFKC